MTAVLDGDEIDADPINELASNTTERPCGRVRQTVAQTGIADNTLTVVTFTTEDHDTHNLHSTVTNTGRVTVDRDGIWEFSGVATLAGQTDYTGNDAVFRINGSTMVAGATRYAFAVASAGNSTHDMPVSCQVDLNNGDYVELMVRHDRTGSGTSSTVVNSFLASILEWQFIRPN